MFNNESNFKKSIELYNNAINIMPDGVSSPIRAIKPFPFYIKNGYQSKIYDVDDNEYLDYCLAYGPLILGHSNNYIKSAIIDQLNKGWLYGTPCELEINLAKKLIKYYKSIDMLRFVSTGTEATMSSIRLARGFTKKNKIIKVKGGFHGSHDSVLIKAGSGFLNNNISQSSGIPKEISCNTLQVNYNDIESLVQLIESNEAKDDIACMIIEPILGNIGCIKPQENYLSEIRKITLENDIILIFDEVITGCRLSCGGAQEYYNITPDITTLGKVIGGGLPIGAFGGKKEIMECISPKGDVYQAGTFSGNPLSLCAGLATLNYIEKNNVFFELNESSSYFYKSITDILADNKIDKKYHFEFISSMFTFFFGQKPKNYDDVLKCDLKKYMHFWNLMLKDGVFFPPSQFETSFISFTHSIEDFDKTINIFEKNIKKVDKDI